MEAPEKDTVKESKKVGLFALSIGSISLSIFLYAAYSISIREARAIQCLSFGLYLSYSHISLREKITAPWV